MLSVQNMRLQTLADGHMLVDNLSFTVNPGDKVAIIGHEGTGKSTLLKWLENPDSIPYAEGSGHVVKNGRCGYLEQDIRARWGACTPLEFFTRLKPDGPIEPHHYAWLDRLSRTLRQVGFPEERYDETRCLSDYSGGEIVKFGLVKILLSEPEILLLDEPTNDLDFATILFLEQFIADAKQTVLFISHDERLLSHTATGIIHLRRVHQKTRAESAFLKVDYATYRDLTLSHYEKTRRQALKERAEHKQKRVKFQRIYERTKHLQNQAVRNPTAGRLLKKKMKSLKSQSRRFDKTAEAFTPIPEPDMAIDLHFSKETALPRGKRVCTIDWPTLSINGQHLSGPIQLEIKGAEKIGIIGSNGVGKTTLLKQLVNTLKKDPSLVVGWMPQDYGSLENADSALSFLLPCPDRLQEAKVRKMMGAMQFERSEMTAPTHQLSGGQKCKLYLLKMVLDGCNVLILDEPTRNLSPLSAPRVHDLLADFAGCIVAVTHDRTFLEAVFDTILLLDTDGLHTVS
ncbi:MAG: ABC transporter ATP-binding protein [Acholeplasmatales bacterium]|nr:MAG: ABC transporter ATP-binding protein [Acholeplasmatales bacterium]